MPCLEAYTAGVSFGGFRCNVQGCAVPHVIASPARRSPAPSPRCGSARLRPPWPTPAPSAPPTSPCAAGSRARRPAPFSLLMCIYTHPRPVSCSVCSCEPLHMTSSAHLDRSGTAWAAMIPWASATPWAVAMSRAAAMPWAAAALWAAAMPCAAATRCAAAAVRAVAKPWAASALWLAAMPWAASALWPAAMQCGDSVGRGDAMRCGVLMGCSGVLGGGDAMGPSLMAVERDSAGSRPSRVRCRPKVGQSRRSVVRCRLNLGHPWRRNDISSGMLLGQRGVACSGSLRRPSYICDFPASPQSPF